VVTPPAANAGSKAKEKSNEAILSRLSKAFAAFEETRKDANEAFEKELEQASNSVKKDKSLDVDEKMIILKEITDAKASFQVAGTLPVSVITTTDVLHGKARKFNLAGYVTERTTRASGTLCQRKTSG